MRCERYEPDLTAGAAGGTITGDLEAHLEVCVACRRRLAEKRALLESLDQVLRADLEVEPSPALRHRLISRVVEAESGRRRMAPWLAAATLAAGLAMVLLAGGLGRRPSANPVDSSGAATVPDAPARAAVPAETPALMRARPSEVGAAAPLVRRASPAATARSTVRPEPGVLVPHGQEEALMRFVAGLREEADIPRPLLRASASVESPVHPPPPIDIPLLANEPLADPEDPLERSKS